jgi:hypothetical protein
MQSVLNLLGTKPTDDRGRPSADLRERYAQTIFTFWTTLVLFSLIAMNMKCCFTLVRAHQLRLLIPYIHTYVHTLVRGSACTHAHTYIHTYTHTYVHACIHECMHASILVHIHSHTYIYTYIHTYIAETNVVTSNYTHVLIKRNLWHACWLPETFLTAEVRMRQLKSV